MIETLYSNKWLSLKCIVVPWEGITGYVYSHETRCDGKIVVVLPYRFRTGGDGDDHCGDIRVEFLLTNEIVPCWDLATSPMSAITGGWEETDDQLCRATAVRELWEESGYLVADSALISLGRSFASKSSDTVYHLYTVELGDRDPTGDGCGDGSELEAKATCRWVGRDELLDSSDPQVHVAYNRLMRRWDGFH